MSTAAPAESIYRNIIRLGWPVFISQLAIMANGMIDTVMAGRLSAQDLAAVGLGAASIGALVTRGVAEVARIGQALGAGFDAFAGLACFGDLFAAVAGSDRPELVLGQALAAGATPELAREQAGGSIEGLDIARRVAEFGVRRKIDTPIAQAIADIVEGKLGNADAVRRLMQRGVGSES